MFFEFLSVQMTEVTLFLNERLSDALERSGCGNTRVFIDQDCTQEIDVDRTGKVLGIAPGSTLYGKRKTGISLFINPIQAPVFPEPTLDIESGDTIQTLKARIAERSGVAAEKIRLVFKGEELKVGTVAEHGLEEHSEVFLFVS